MKIHLRYILSNVLVSCHSQSVLIQSKAVFSYCWALVHLEEINLSWPIKALKYGFWYYCLFECRICSSLIELLYGSCRCNTQNESPAAFLSASLLGSKIQTMPFAQQCVVSTWNLQVVPTKYFLPIRGWRTLPPGLPQSSFGPGPFKPPGSSSPLLALSQQCWSPAPHSHVLSQSYQATCVLHSKPDLGCPWGDAKYWVLVLPLCPSAALLLPEAVAWVPQLQAPWSEGSVGFCSASHTHHFWGTFCFKRNDKIHNQCFVLWQDPCEVFVPSIPLWWGCSSFQDCHGSHGSHLETNFVFPTWVGCGFSGWNVHMVKNRVGRMAF